jgi:hypothetical protein
MSHLSFGTATPYAVLVLAVLAIGEAVRAHHLRRLAISAIVGTVLAVTATAGVGAWHHQRLAASAAAGHTTVTHLLLIAGAIGALVFTGIAYGIATVRDRGGEVRGGGGRRIRRRRSLPPPPSRPMLPPGGFYGPGGY